VEREPDVDAVAEDPQAAALPVGAAELAAIFAGGFLGAVVRAGLDEALGAAPGSWPWPTFAVNLVACALLGCAIAWLGGHHPRTMRARAFLATGVCGSLSTFSTLMIELIRLDERSGLGSACAYGAASVAGGLAAVVLGVRLGTRGAAR
jgi:CrcB protein